MNLGISLALGSRSGGGFNPAAALFGTGEQGYWLDASDFSTMFQDAAGTTPVTAVGQSVRRWLDKSQGLVLGPELVTNGGPFSNTTGWTARPGVAMSVSNSRLVADFTGGTELARVATSLTCVVGASYRVAFTVRRRAESSGNTIVIASQNSALTGGSVSTSLLSANETDATLSFIFTATATTMWVGVSNSVFNAVVEIASAVVNELPGNHFTQANVANAPILQVDGTGRYFLLFDGTDDWLSSAATINPGAVDKAQVFAGVRKLSDAGDQALLETSVGASFNNGAISLFTPVSGGANYNYGSRGTTFRGTTATTFTAPITNVVTGISDISGGVAQIRVNGAVAGTNTGDQGTGNYLAYPHFIGRRGGATLSFNGRIYQLITRYGANLSADQITQTETFVNARTGAF